jgi:hypothetical protein
MKKNPLLACLAAILVCAPLPAAWARPNMWWDHFESLAANQADCVNKAETILADEKAGQPSRDADSVRAWTENSVAVAECIQFGDKLIVSVMVSSDDSAAGNTLYSALRAGMAKK